MPIHTCACAEKNSQWHDDGDDDGDDDCRYVQMCVLRKTHAGMVKNTCWHDEGNADGHDDCRYMPMFVLKKKRERGGMMLAMIMVMVMIADLSRCLC